MTAGFPTYCGWERAGIGCTQLAVVRVEGATYSATACTGHRGAVERKAASGGKAPRVTPITQDAGAVAGDGQMTLFDLDGAA